MRNDAIDIHLSVSPRANDPEALDGYVYTRVQGMEAFRQSIAHDHACCQFKDDRRVRENFISTGLLYAEVDNASDDPAEWVTVEKFCQDFREYRFILYTSLHHRQAWLGKPSRDRYHILFPLDQPETGPNILSYLLISLIQSYTTESGLHVFNKSCESIDWHFGGNPSANVIANLHPSGQSSLKSIIEFIDAHNPYFKNIYDETSHVAGDETWGREIQRELERKRRRD